MNPAAFSKNLTWFYIEQLLPHLSLIEDNLLLLEKTLTEAGYEDLIMASSAYKALRY